MNTVEPESLVEQFQVRVVGEFGPLQVQGDPPTELASAAHVTLNLRLHWEPSRQFRDGSVGRLVEFDEAEMVSHQDDKTSVVPLELVGRAVELRTFPNGEVLDISWISRVSGVGRSMDVFDIVFSALSPSPPKLDEGQSVKRRIMLPYRDGNRLRWDHSVNAVWTHGGDGKYGDTDVTHVEYVGPWKTAGMTRGEPPRTKYDASGDAEGVILYDQQSREMVQHEFVWTRQVQVIGSQGILTQEQSFTGTVERLP